MLPQLFGPEIRHMLQESDRAEMKTFLEELHPATVAEALAGELEVEQAWKFLENTSLDNQAAIFEYFPPDWQEKMVGGVGRERMAKLLGEMSHDDRVDLLRRLDPKVSESLVRLVDEADRRDIALLVNQDEDTVGGWMTTDYAWLPPHLTATEALDRLRLQAPEKETIYYIYVLDENHRLLGVVSLRDLILAARHVRIQDLMDENVVYLRASDDVEKAVQELAHYDLIALPVVDDQHRMVGIVTHDDVMDVVIEEATEDVHRLGAVGPLEENYLEAGFVTVWRNRVVWLSILFVGGIFTVMALSQFQKTLESVVVLSMFIPLCISVGGNSGSQAATLITRSLALGHVEGKQWRQVLRHEILMGLALGLTLAALGFVIALVTHFFLIDDAKRQDTNVWLLAAVVSSAVVGICLWGTLVGSMLPLILKRVGIDPAIASNPFVATLADVTGIFIFFTAARVFILP